MTKQKHYEVCNSLPIGLIAAVVLLGAPTPLFAQKGNETGLPLYPNTNTGTQYPPSPEGYAIYTCQSPDTLAAVEEWYRHALLTAKESQDNNQLTHGIVLTNGKDRARIPAWQELGSGDRASEICALGTAGG